MHHRRLSPPLLLQPSLTPADKAMIRALAVTLGGGERGVRVTIREQGASTRFHFGRGDDELPFA